MHKPIAIFESQDDYLNRIDDDEKLALFKIAWPTCMIYTDKEIKSMFSLLYKSTTVKKILDEIKDEYFIVNLLTCNFF